MPFWRLYYHLVWATKEREPLITPDVEGRLLGFLVQRAATLDVHVYAIDGWLDHIHLVVSIPPSRSVAAVVKDLKGASSYAMTHEIRPAVPFGWQSGYGALSVGERQRDIAVAYVRGQKRHHGGTGIVEWLERCADDDAGPAGDRRAEAQLAISEGRVEYEADEPGW